MAAPKRYPISVPTNYGDDKLTQAQISQQLRSQIQQHDVVTQLSLEQLVKNYVHSPKANVVDDQLNFEIIFTKGNWTVQEIAPVYRRELVFTQTNASGTPETGLSVSAKLLRFVCENQKRNNIDLDYDCKKYFESIRVDTSKIQNFEKTGVE